MIKLALIGKDIQHSRSPEIYKKLLSSEIQYDLLDYPRSALIPGAAELLDIYDGISITSPYKKHFIDQVELTSNATSLGAINCLKKNASGIYGENTDFLALLDILQKHQETSTNLNVILLGDGVMSKVAQHVFLKLQIEWKMYSRKTTEHLNHLNTNQIFHTEFVKPGRKIIVNTCAREFVFRGNLDKDTLFWDFNYNFKPHSDFLSSQCNYVDGMEMLRLQAEHALAFWSIKSI